MSELETAAAAPEAAPVDTTPAPAAPVQDTAPSSEPVEHDDVADSLRDIWQRNNAEPAETGAPERDEKGRFVSREAPAEGEAAPAEAAAPEAPAEATEEPPAPAIEAPRAWNAEAKAKWAALPPDLQQVVASREQELQDIKTASGRLNAEYQPLKETIDAYKPYLDQVAAGDVPGYLQRVLAASHALDSNPAQTIKLLADTYGVDLGELYDPLADPPNAELTRLRQENARLHHLAQATERQRAASTEAAQLAEVNRTVEEFYSKHPDAREIEEDFAAEIQAVRLREPNKAPAAVLQEAYERAVWANPTMRQKRLAEVAKAEEAKRIEAAKANASKARSAASVNVAGSPAAANGSDDDWHAQMASIFRKNSAA